MKKYIIAGMLLATGMVQAGNPVEKAYGVELIKLGGILGERIDKTVYGCLMKVSNSRRSAVDTLVVER